MALITCPECGKEISDKATACPHCGCPTSEILKSEDTNTVSMVNDESWEDDDIQSGSIKCTKKIGPVQIDENNKMFRIKGSVPVVGKKNGLAKSLVKGMLAVSTLGTSVAVSKMAGIGGNKQRVGDKTWLHFSDLVDYELLEDDIQVTSGGVGRALIGGAVFGGVGAIAGGITAKRTEKKKVENLTIKVTMNNFDCPCLMIPLIMKPTKTNSKDYQEAFNLAHQILSALDVITHNQ